MEDLLIETLEQMGYPVCRHGSFADDEEYPRSFFTFWNNGTEKDGFFDNKASRLIWSFDLNFYSTDTPLIYSAMAEAVKLLEDAGFITSGLGHDVPSDEPTHTGRGMEIEIIEKIDREEKENGR